MNSLEDNIAFVNNQEKFHIERAKIFANNPYKKTKHLETAEKFENLALFINSLANEKEPEKEQKKFTQLKLSLSPQDIEDLPEDLIKELSISDADKAEFVILNMIEEAGGIMSLDQIIVGLYKLTNEINKRNAITNRMYRMGNKGLIHAVPNKKGVYSLEPISDEDSSNLK